MGVKNYAGVTNDLDVATKKYVDDSVVSYTFSGGVTESSGTVTVDNPVPSLGSGNEGKVLGISNGSLGWVTPAVQQELRYAIVVPTATTSTTDSADDTISATLQDRAVNVVEAGSGVDYVNLTFPASEQGYARDFFVRLVLTGTDVPAVSFSETGGGDVEFDVDDDSWAEIDLGVNLLMFTETSQQASQGE